MFKYINFKYIYIPQIFYLHLFITILFYHFISFFLLHHPFCSTIYKHLYCYDSFKLWNYKTFFARSTLGWNEVIYVFYFKRCLPKSLLLPAYNNNTHVGYIANKYLLSVCIVVFFPQNNTRCSFI